LVSSVAMRLLAWMAVVGLAAAPGCAANPFQEEYLGELHDAARNLQQLAEAMPEAKCAWRPGEGVRSVSAVYLRILVHMHEHMGQAVAYARVNGVVPPWSQKQQ
jgi:uncharacterized damage-inducible protein DinB